MPRRALFLGMLLLPAILRAEETMPSLEELLSAEIEGASRYAQPLSEAPATASLITADDMARYGHETLADALSMARGVHVTNDHAYSLLGIRGFSRPGDYNSRIQLQVNGARYNDVAYDQAMLGTEAPIDLGWVKRLEFVPGASSALYGGNALFGIANAVLWSGADIDGARISAKTGSPGRYGVSLIAGRGHDDGSDWVTGITLEQSGGNNFNFPEFATAGRDGTVRGLDGSRTIKAFGQYSHAGWRISGSYASRDKDIPTAYYNTVFGVPGNDVQDRHLHLDLTHASALSPQLGQFARIHLGGYNFTANYIYPTTLSRDKTSARWWSGEYRLNYSGFPDHQWQLGLEVRRNDHIQQWFGDISPAATYLDDHRSNANYGGFIQDEWRISRQWIANLGYRIDKPAQHSAIGSPRLALIFKPVPEASLKLLHGHAFRMANAYERFYGDGISQKANPGLKPEQIETSELSLDYALTPAVRIGLGNYFTRMRDMITQVTDPADNLRVFANQGPVTARGWETEAEALLGDGWRIRGSLTWQRVDEMGNEAINAPRRLGKLFVDGPLTSQWTLGFSLQSTSSRLGLAGTVPGHAVGSLTLRQTRPGPSGQWSISWRNIGDVRHDEPAGSEHRQILLPQTGQQWLLRWDYRL